MHDERPTIPIPGETNEEILEEERRLIAGLRASASLSVNASARVCANSTRPTAPPAATIEWWEDLNLSF